MDRGVPILGASRLYHEYLATRHPTSDIRETPKMRNLLVIAALLSGLLSTDAAGAESDFVVTLLGTASPAPRPDRFGPSTLVEAGDQKLVIDAGRGVPIRLWQLGIPLGEIDVLLLTHFHSDHTAGIPDLWLTGWLGVPYGNRASPFHVSSRGLIPMFD